MKQKYLVTAYSRTPHRPTRSCYLLSFSLAPLLDFLLSHSLISYFFCLLFIVCNSLLSFRFNCLSKLFKVYGYSSSDHENDVTVPFIC